IPGPQHGDHNGRAILPENTPNQSESLISLVHSVQHALGAAGQIVQISPEALARSRAPYGRDMKDRLNAVRFRKFSRSGLDDRSDPHWPAVTNRVDQLVIDNVLSHVVGFVLVGPKIADVR